MFKRGPLILLALGAAVGVPLVMTSSGGMFDKMADSWSSWFGGDKPADVAPIDSPTAKPAGVPEPRLEGLPTDNLADVIRFDVSPSWIMSRWSVVSTAVGDIRYHGYRVPISTGTGPDDLTGSLDYYFDPQQRVRRIKLWAETGDPAPLVALVTSRFKLVWQQADRPGEFLYQARWNGKPSSELRIQMKELLRADVPHRRFDLDLEINLPGENLSRLAVAAPANPAR